MANLSQIEKIKLEDLLGMGSGYVLDFSDTSFSRFFESHSINIDDPKYSQGKPSTSKANRLRGFWEQEGDKIVGTILKELIETFEYQFVTGTVGGEGCLQMISVCKPIAERLLENSHSERDAAERRDFLETTFVQANFETLPVADSVKMLLFTRLQEADICLHNNAPLASIFLAGSILEGILLGVASQHPERFNRASSCPKTQDGQPLSFQQWSLAQFIDTGREIGVLGEDVKKFSHALRDFRNYIHPYQQMSSGFTPDEDTAKICLQVVKAAMSDVVQYRRLIHES